MLFNIKKKHLKKNDKYSYSFSVKYETPAKEKTNYSYILYNNTGKLLKTNFDKISGDKIFVLVVSNVSDFEVFLGKKKDEDLLFELKRDSIIDNENPSISITTNQIDEEVYEVKDAENNKDKGVNNDNVNENTDLDKDNQDDNNDNKNNKGNKNNNGKNKKKK